MWWTLPLASTIVLALIPLIRLPKVYPNNAIDTANRNANYGIAALSIAGLWLVYLGAALMHGRIL